MDFKKPSDRTADVARANEQRRDSALLRATTELFVLDVIHDRDEIRRYEEIATHLLPKVSAADRTFVSERLSICSDAPTSVVRMLARDAIDVAAPVIRHSAALGPIDLLAVIAATGVGHHRLIAQRSLLTPEVIRALRLTGDAVILARLDADAGRKPTTLNEQIIDHSAAPQVSGIYQSNRLDPWRFLGLDRTARLKLIADIAARPPPMPYAANTARLDRAFRSILSAAQIVGYARSGQLAPIIGAIAEGLGLPPSLVTAGLNDKSGELFAIMLKALRLDDTQARQVFLLAAPSGREVATFFPLSDLYGGMEPSVAETLVAAWRDATAAGKPKHEPHLTENGDRRRSSNTEAARPAAQSPEEQAKRA